jgi:hypothetical protein
MVGRTIAFSLELILLTHVRGLRLMAFVYERASGKNIIVTRAIP